VSILVLTITCGGALAAPTTVTGEVVDEDGQRVAGAQVWLIRSERWQEEALLKATTADDAGRFALAEVEFVPSTERNYDLTVAAYRAGLAIGWSRLGHKPTGLRVVCTPARETRSRVVSSEGKAIMAQVEPTEVQLATLRRPSRPRGKLVLPPEIAKEFRVSTMPDGTFAVPWCPAGGAVLLEASAPGYGKGFALIPSGGGQDMVLQRAGRVRGRLVCEERPDLVAGVHVSRDLRIGSFERRVRTDAEGRFEINEVAPPFCFIHVHLDPRIPWRARRRTVEVRPGETTDIRIAVEPAFAIRGRIVDADDGHGVPGMTIQVSSQARDAFEEARTDDDGRFALYALPGEYQVIVVSPSTPYVRSPETEAATIRVGAENEGVTVPDMAVERGAVLRGVVVGPEGEAVPWAVVCSYVAPGGGRQWVSCDDTGEFQIGGLDRGAKLMLAAHSGQYVTPKPVAASVRRRDPVRVPLDGPAGARLRLQVVDEKGQPRSGVCFSATWQADPLGHWPLDLGETDEAGSLESPPLWPFGEYKVRVGAPSDLPGREMTWTPKPGEAHDLGKVTIPRGTGAVAGRVLDGRGRPLAGATVLNRTEAPEARVVQTDADGRFRLEGLYEGQAYVFARAPGCLTTGTLVAVGDENITLTVRALPGRVLLAPDARVQSLTDRDTELSVANSLIEEGLAMIPHDIPEDAGDEESARWWLIAALARIDAGAAFELSAKFAGRYDDSIREEAAEALIERNPDVALRYLLEVKDGRRSVWARVRVAKGLLRSDAGKARELLEEAIELAKEASPRARRARLLAEAGAALWRLDPKAAEPVIRAAAEGLRPKTERDAFIAGDVAKALCLVDLPQALQLVNEPGEGWWTASHLTDIAVRVAPIVPEEADKLVGDSPEDAIRVLFAMAPADYERAIRIAEGMQWETYQARAFGYIAEAVAAQRPGHYRLRARAGDRT